MTIAQQIVDFVMIYKKPFVITAGLALLKSHQEKKAGPLLTLANEYYQGSGQAQPDYAKALELFRDLHKEYPRTISGAIAQYYIGNSLVNLGKPDEAITEYRYFIDKYSDEKFLLGLVHQRLGYLYIGLGKKTEAIQEFEKAEALNGPGVPTIELARLYEMTGNMMESQKKYKVIQEKFSGTMWAMEAMGKVQAVAPAVPQKK